jgi:hypothetical protein
MRWEKIRQPLIGYETYVLAFSSRASNIKKTMKAKSQEIKYRSIKFTKKNQ